MKPRQRSETLRRAHGSLAQRIWGALLLVLGSSACTTVLGLGAEATPIRPPEPDAGQRCTYLEAWSPRCQHCFETSCGGLVSTCCGQEECVRQTFGLTRCGFNEDCLLKSFQTGGDKNPAFLEATSCVASRCLSTCSPTPPCAALSACCDELREILDNSGQKNVVLKEANNFLITELTVTSCAGMAIKDDPMTCYEGRTLNSVFWDGCSVAAKRRVAPTP